MIARVSLLTGLVLFSLAPRSVARQEQQTLREAQAAYDRLDYEQAIVLVQRALGESLPRDGLVHAYELLAFLYATLDSASQAVAAFSELILLDPNREPDPLEFSGRITSRYNEALNRVLVVRYVELEPATFEAGHGAAIIRFQVTRAATVTARAIDSDGVETFIDSATVAGRGLLQWNGLSPEGTPLPRDLYDVELTAIGSVGDEVNIAAIAAEIEYEAVDTIPHLLSLPGYTIRPELERPPRSFRPLGVALLYTLLGAGAAVALEQSDIVTGVPREIVGVSALAFVAGVFASLKSPPRQPVEANIEFNRLIQEQLVSENENIALRNQDLRTRVVLTLRTPTTTR